MYNGAEPSAMLRTGLGGLTGLKDGEIRRGRDWLSGLTTVEYMKRVNAGRAKISIGLGPFEAFGRRDLAAPPGRW